MSAVAMKHLAFKKSAFEKRSLWILIAILTIFDWSAFRYKDENQRFPINLSFWVKFCFFRILTEVTKSIVCLFSENELFEDSGLLNLISFDVLGVWRSRGQEHLIHID